VDTRFLQNGPRMCWAVYHSDGRLDGVYATEALALSRSTQISCPPPVEVGVMFGVDCRDYIVKDGPVDVKRG
jgi:hypothetical protein